MKKFLTLLLVCMLAFALVACAPADEGTTDLDPEGGEGTATGPAEVRIGLIGPMTGAGAQYGAAMKEAAELAVEEINAAGGINTSFQVGDLMLIEDHINFMGTNPLIGPNDASFGPRFCDMTYTYTPALRQAAQEAAQALGLTLQKGVYLGCTGPSYETPAEIRAFRTLGADAVGMSTVTEALTAAHCGMPLLALSVMTNMAAGVLDRPLTNEEVDETAQLVAGRFSDYMKKIVAAI